jgi:c-di-GMP-binding flagellar brake protein YcgR
MTEKTSEEIVQSRLLSIGIGTRMQFQLGTNEGKFKAAGIMVGMIPDEYLMIRVPAIPGILGRLNEGDPIVVRYVFAGNIYGFSTTIVTSINKPALMVFLAYPHAVETLNLRKARRIQCGFPATVKTESGDLKAVMGDISLGGCRVCLDNDTSAATAFDVGQTVSLSFHLAGVAEEQAIDGKVKNIKVDAQSFEMGVQFDQENEAVLQNVRQYVDSLATDLLA